MEKIYLFLILSIPIIILSRKSLFNIKSHGFYRFFGWECILWLLASNYRYWFYRPFSLLQLLSWIFLFISVYLVTVGVVLMKRSGKPDKSRNDNTLYQFEQTTKLIDKGIFKHIRHPLYSSLLFLTWGIFLKYPTVESLIVSILSTTFLILTTLFDEKECIDFFGDKYTAYMKRSKRFIPYLI